MNVVLFIIHVCLMLHLVSAAPTPNQKRWHFRFLNEEHGDEQLRFIGEKTTTMQPVRRQRASRSVTFPVKVTFAAFDEAWLYINQVEAGHVNDSDSVMQVTHTVKTGDVIAFKVKSNGKVRGIAANVEYQGSSYPTGGNTKAAWKALKATGPFTSWMSKEYSSCTWQRPVTSPTGSTKPGTALAEAKASYVWANPSGSGNTNEAWLRHVIGEEDCDETKNPQTPRKRLSLCDINDPRCQHMWAMLSKSGNTETSKREETTPAKNECRCQPVVGQVSKCYEMYYPGSRFGRCNAYVCGMKYECVENGNEELPMCVKRVVTTRIVPHPTFRSYCTMVSIPETTLYMLLDK